jgi:hypothetical protein
LFRLKERTKQKAVDSPNPVPKRAEQNQLDRSGEWQDNPPYKRRTDLAGHAVLEASRTVDSRPLVSSLSWRPFFVCLRYPIGTPPKIGQLRDVARQCAFTNRLQGGKNNQVFSGKKQDADAKASILA